MSLASVSVEMIMLFAPVAKDFVLRSSVGAMIGARSAACITHGMDVISQTHGFAACVVGKFHVSSTELFLQEFGLALNGILLT